MVREASVIPNLYNENVACNDFYSCDYLVTGTASKDKQVAALKRV